MAWVRVSDDFYDHPKHAELTPVAVGWWLTALAYCNRNLTDGRVPRGAAARLVDLTDLAVADGDVYRPLTWDDVRQELLDANVLEVDGKALLVVDFLDYQPSAEKVKAERRAAADRQKAWRDRRREKADERNGVTNGPVTAAPNPNPKKKDTPSRSSVTDLDGPDDFAAFWQAYPRKIGKANAVKAWTKARRNTEAATIMAGLGNAAQVWRSTGTEDRYVPHAATWLNGGRWADEVALPDMPGAPSAPVAVTMLCPDPDGCPGRHEWTDGANRLRCPGHAA